MILARLESMTFVVQEPGGLKVEIEYVQSISAVSYSGGMVGPPCETMKVPSHLNNNNMQKYFGHTGLLSRG